MKDTRSLFNLQIFCIIAFFLIFMSYIQNKLIITDDLYLNSSIGEQIGFERVEEILDKQKRYEWISYLIIPIIYLLKFSIIALVLLTGFFFFEKKVNFSVIFKAVIFAEIPFLIVPIIKLVWFLFIQTHYTFEDVQYFFPLSALQLFDVKSLPAWQIYPLQLFNVFELIYWVLLAYWLKKLLNISLNKSMEVVASSYGTGLVIWVVFITFLSLNVAP